MWVLNIILPDIARKIGEAPESAGGWMTGMRDALRGRPGIELAVCFPQYGQEREADGRLDSVRFYGFSQPQRVCRQYEPSVERRLREIMEEFRPDIVHIFGTEYMHSLAAVQAFGKAERTVIGIQGMVSVYARHFMAGVPLWVQRGRTFRDLVKRDSLLRQQENFYRRGVFEKEAIAAVGHVIGRTDWDRACTQQVNPRAQYHFCNETLRGNFYEKCWRLEECERHSLFVSQGSYPIKGVHTALEAMPWILERFPDAHLYVAGGDITKADGIKDKLRQSSYGRYVARLISRLHLEGHVSYTGFLDEAAMCERFCRSHVFVSPSSIENSPNSVGEAMLLGMPVVSSDVGGVKNMMIHGEEGFIYQADAPYMLAYYVNCIFAEDGLAKRLGQAAASHACVTHDREKNGRRLMEIYEKILTGGGDDVSQ